MGPAFWLLVLGLRMGGGPAAEAAPPVTSDAVDFGFTASDALNFVLTRDDALDFGFTASDAINFE